MGYKLSVGLSPALFQSAHGNQKMQMEMKEAPPEKPC